MIIGYLNNEYPEQRCIIGLCGGGIVYRKLSIKKESSIERFINRVLNHVKYRLGVRGLLNWDKSAKISSREFKDPFSADIIHTFNTVCDIKNQWCCTFESEIPVTNKLIGRDWERKEEKHFQLDSSSKNMLKICAKRNCNGIIAISSSAYKIQYELIKRSDLKDKQKKDLFKKLVCIHPPQKRFISDEEMNRKFKNVEITQFIFVGHDFFRKGGKQILGALKKLSADYNFRLIIVSKLNYGDYASVSCENDYKDALALIHSARWIEYYETLANEDVVELMRKSHIGLLPSLAETYGYSVLEMQAAGCPCITTNIRALGEINNDKRGWICDINPNGFGEAIYGSDNEEHKRAVQNQLENELLRVFNDIFQNQRIIEEKAHLSVKYIEENHNPDMISKMIQDIYQK